MPDAPERPNVLFIAIDDLRDVWQFDPALETPNLDRLLERGVHFRRAYVQGSMCAPSRASYLSGCYPETTGVYNNADGSLAENRPGLEALPACFRRNGYHTEGIGEIDHHGAPANWDVAHPDPDTRPPGEAGEGRNLTDGVLEWCRWRAAAGTDGDQPDGQIAQQAIDFLQEPPTEPFFFGAGFHSPHDPYVAPAEYFERYPLEDISLPETPADASPTPSYQLVEEFTAPFAAFGEREKRELRRAYYAGVSFLDAQIGRILDALDATGRWSDTIVVLASDHGYHLGERDWWNKSTLYEYSLRSPMVIAAPGAGTNGTACQSPVEFVDLYPTLAELTGVEPTHDLEGQSLCPLLEDPTRAWDGAAYSTRAYDDIYGRTLRTDRWRYIQWRSRSDGDMLSEELFDHDDDPAEHYDRSGEQGYQEPLDSLRGRMEATAPRPT